MKQLWLLEPPEPTERVPAIPLDPQTRNELLSLMATAIETVHIHQAKGQTKDEGLAASHEDHGTTPQS